MRRTRALWKLNGVSGIYRGFADWSRSFAEGSAQMDKGQVALEAILLSGVRRVSDRE